MSHKNRDWSKYNKSLVNRGNIFLWVSPEALSEECQEEKMQAW